MSKLKTPLGSPDLGAGGPGPAKGPCCHLPYFFFQIQNQVQTSLHPKNAPIEAESLRDNADAASIRV